MYLLYAEWSEFGGCPRPDMFVSTWSKKIHHTFHQWTQAGEIAWMWIFWTPFRIHGKHIIASLWKTVSPHWVLSTFAILVNSCHIRVPCVGPQGFCWVDIKAMLNLVYVGLGLLVSAHFAMSNLDLMLGPYCRNVRQVGSILTSWWAHICGHVRSMLFVCWAEHGATSWPQSGRKSVGFILEQFYSRYFLDYLSF